MLNTLKNISAIYKQGKRFPGQPFIPSYRKAKSFSVKP
ncbi:MAG: hypothetical protein IEMM0006_1961 [bacterium]|nr:MAG: hypothetical protein IEMM0006_1961 [bacterium]